MINQKVSIRRAINDAQASMALNDISDIENLFVEWAFEGDRKINSSVTYEHKECNIDISDHCGKLPFDFFGLEGLMFNGQKMELATSHFRNFGNGIARAYNYSSLTDIPVDEAYVSWLMGYWPTLGIKYSIQNNSIYTQSIEEGQISISYLGLCLDEEGFPKIKDSHTDAVSHYLQYRYYQTQFNRFPEKRGYRERMMLAKERWHELCGQAYGEDEMPDRLEQEVIIAIWNNMLPLPNLDRI